ncbi:hypothetical protein XEUV354_23900, partial [Xanthomonas euvesicatoria]
TDSFLHRNGFTGQHRLIDTGATFDDFPIDRHLLARSYAKQITHMHVIQRNVLFAPIGFDAASRLGRQPQQGLDGCRGLERARSSSSWPSSVSETMTAAASK